MGAGGRRGAAAALVAAGAAGCEAGDAAGAAQAANNDRSMTVTARQLTSLILDGRRLLDMGVPSFSNGSLSMQLI